MMRLRLTALIIVSLVANGPLDSGRIDALVEDLPSQGDKGLTVVLPKHQEDH